MKQKKIIIGTEDIHPDDKSGYWLIIKNIRREDTIYFVKEINLDNSVQYECVFADVWTSI